MKKIYLSFIFFAVCILITQTLFSQGEKAVIFATNGYVTNTTEEGIVDSIESWGYEYTIFSDDVFLAEASKDVPNVGAFDTFDVCIIIESVDSDYMKLWGTVLEFPIPTVTLEGYLTQETRWEWITSGNFVEISDGEIDKMTIVDNTHYITEVFDQDEVIQWSTAAGGIEKVPGSTIDLIDNVSVLGSWVAEDPAGHDDALWAIEPSAAVPNRVAMFGSHESGYGAKSSRLTPDIFIILKRMIEWALEKDQIGIKENIQSPVSFAKAYPNPFNGSSNIQFKLTQSSNVSITIYNSMGQLVETVVNTKYNAGNHNVGINLPAGSYFYTVKANNQVQTGRLIAY